MDYCLSVTQVVGLGVGVEGQSVGHTIRLCVLPQNIGELLVSLVIGSHCLGVFMSDLADNPVDIPICPEKVYLEVQSMQVLVEYLDELLEVLVLVSPHLI